MDKSWTELRDRVSLECFNEVDKFLNFAYPHNDNPYIKCPCRKCLNRFFPTRDTVREHIIVNGFMSNYKTCTLHGEGKVPLNNDQNEENRGLLL